MCNSDPAMVNKGGDIAIVLLTRNLAYMRGNGRIPVPVLGSEDLELPDLRLADLGEEPLAGRPCLFPNESSEPWHGKASNQWHNN